MFNRYESRRVFSNKKVNAALKLHYIPTLKSLSRLLIKQGVIYK
ncbi:hypothetical protein [Vibrio gallaecicus]|nr:hypothetical protein [Vibrio gallaecicus]MDN3613430.1 hypothetical protein [Vibrio gallaecicus]